MRGGEEEEGEKGKGNEKGRLVGEGGEFKWKMERKWWEGKWRR